MHSSDLPNAWSMSKTLTAALAVSGVNIIGATILLFLADLGRANWWHLFDISLDAETNPALQNITNGEARGRNLISLALRRKQCDTCALRGLASWPEAHPCAVSIEWPSCDLMTWQCCLPGRSCDEPSQSCDADDTVSLLPCRLWRACSLR